MSSNPITLKNFFVVKLNHSLKRPKISKNCFKNLSTEFKLELNNGAGKIQRKKNVMASNLLEAAAA